MAAKDAFNTTVEYQCPQCGTHYRPLAKDMIRGWLCPCGWRSTMAPAAVDAWALLTELSADPMAAVRERAESRESELERIRKRNKSH